MSSISAGREIPARLVHSDGCSQADRFLVFARCSQPFAVSHILGFIVMICLAGFPQAAFCEPTEEQETPTHRETKPIRFAIPADGKIETIAMDADGNLLAAISWPDKNAKTVAPPPNQQPLPPARLRPGVRPGRPEFRKGPRMGMRKGPPHEASGPRLYAIKVLSPSGRVLKTWSLKSTPAKMVTLLDDSTVLIGGKGTLAMLGRRGKIKKQLDVTKVLEGKYAQAAVSGLAASKDYLFVAFGNGFSVRASEDIVRFNRDFSSPKILVEQQHGCCAHLDLDVQNEMLLVAENSRFRVNRYDFEGKQIDTWGQRDRTSIEGFAACCNPVNFDFGPQGVLYTAESGIGRVKRFSSDGTFLGLTGYVDTTEYDKGSRLASMSCYIPIEVSKDGKRIYIMDIRANLIRVLVQK